jgi:hypothetical protein
MGASLTGLFAGVGGAYMVWQDTIFLRGVRGIPEPAVPAIVKTILIFHACGTAVALGLSIWAFVGLKKWAKIAQ